MGTNKNQMKNLVTSLLIFESCEKQFCRIKTQSSLLQVFVWLNSHTYKGQPTTKHAIQSLCWFCPSGFKFHLPKGFSDWSTTVTETNKESQSVATTETMTQIEQKTVRFNHQPETTQMFSLSRPNRYVYARLHNRHASACS